MPFRWSCRRNASLRAVSDGRALPPADYEALMREALREAELAGQAGELPIGSVVVLDGEIVGRGRSRPRARRPQLAHAERAALLDAGEAIWQRHDDAVVLTTVEPCPLCLGATVMADVPHILFAARDRLAAIPEAVTEIPSIPRHIATYRGGLLENESLALVRRYDERLLRYLVED